jgi:hypothetical protein
MKSAGDPFVKVQSGRQLTGVLMKMFSRTMAWKPQSEMFVGEN